jgi:selT/selW/selH-like putative selenoprotein
VRLAEEVAGGWAPILVDISLKSGTKGRFEVSVDDRLVFSKANLGRHPKPGEVLALLKPVLGEPIDWR